MTARRARRDWDASARGWLALVALLATPALIAPLALAPLPDAFPTSLAGVLSAFVHLSSYAIVFALLAAAAAGLATWYGRLAPRVLIVLWALVGVTAVVAVTTAGRLAAYGL